MNDFPNDWQRLNRFTGEDDNFSMASARHYVLHAEKFGLEPAIMRAGGRILVSPSRWYYCLYRQSRRSD